MRILILLILFSIFNISYAEDFNLADRISEDHYYRDSYSLIYKNTSYSKLNNFKKEISILDVEKKLQVADLINELTQIVPSKFLRPLIYWKVISPDKEKLAQVISYIMRYKSNTLRDFYHSLNITNKEKAKAGKMISSIYHRKDFYNYSFFSSLIDDFDQKSKIIASLPKTKDFITAIKETRAISFNLQEHSNIKPYSLSFSGLIPGNQIKIFNNNPVDPERMEFYSNKDTIVDFKFENQEHIAFITDPIFIQLKEMFNSANQSIFISVKEINGSIGLASMSYIFESVKEKIKKRSDFKVLILVQEKTPFTQFIHNIIEKTPHLKASVHLIYSNENIKKNNSKVVVIDANSDRPTALIGSKNWSDHKGGYFFDNDIWIKGPGAALVQNSFIHDLVILGVQTELLNYFKISRDTYPFSGNQSIRLTEASMDGKVNNTRDTIIDMIKNAKSHIYMEQLYLYDTYIINALVKRKLEIPKLDIRILADHNSNVGLNGLPNSIYLRELKLYKIQVKSRRNSTLVKNDKVFHSENHRNTISVDGEVLQTGSASMSPEALQGTSREMGIQIFDHSAIRKFENNFLISWNDRDRVMNLDIQNFRAKTNRGKISREISSLINAISSSLLAVKDEILEKF